MRSTPTLMGSCAYVRQTPMIASDRFLLTPSDDPYKTASAFFTDLVRSAP